MNLQIVEIFTDGACLGNPGAGGWAALLRYGVHEKILSGGEAHSTNNRMELMAVIVALQALKRPCLLHIFTDSQYVLRGMTEWIANWKRKNWKDVKNPDLWQQLDQLAQNHQIEWHWVKGHAGHPENEQVDQAAREAAFQFV